MKPGLLVTSTVLVFLLLISPASHGQEDWRNIEWGDFIVRIGGSYIKPDDESKQVKFPLFQSLDLFTTRWDIDSETTWNISGAWRPQDDWGIELVHLGATQFDPNLTRFNGIPGRESISLGNFETTSTSVFLNWYLLGPLCMGRPYLGIGVTYTDYHNESLSGEFSRYLIDEEISTGPGRLGLGHSWGGAAQAGIDFKPMRDVGFLLNASVIYFKSDTSVTVSHPTRFGKGRLVSSFDLDPWVFSLGVGYQF